MAENTPSPPHHAQSIVTCETNRKLSAEQCHVDKFLLASHLKRAETNSRGADMYAYALGERPKWGLDGAVDWSHYLISHVFQRPETWYACNCYFKSPSGKAGPKVYGVTILGGGLEGGWRWGCRDRKGPRGQVVHYDDWQVKGWAHLSKINF